MIFSARNEENHEVKNDESPTPNVMNGRSIVTTRRKYTRRSNPPPSSQEYYCDICKAVFYSRKGLVDHMTNKHMGKKVPNMPHSCPECRKRFRLKSQMVIHRRCHTGERPYVCDVRICKIDSISVFSFQFSVKPYSILAFDTFRCAAKHLKQ